MKYQNAFDTTEAVGESIRDVLTTLIEAIVLVILVIFIFLQDWRSTIIPAVTIPVSLIGTFAFVKLLGFSVNTLTLFGITLATGLVVDDAIVVIENIERHVQEGESRHAQGGVGRHVGSGGRGHRHLAGAGRGVCAGGVLPRHHRHSVSPVRADHRILDFDLRVQRADPHARRFPPSCWAASMERKNWFFKRVDRVINGVTEGYRRTLRVLPAFPAGRGDAVLCRPGPHLSGFPARAQRLRAQ